MTGRRGAPERFLTTVLMTDIVGSTEHAAELGDTGWRELVQQHHAVVRAALRRNGGRVMDTAGDGFFAIFDAPAAAVRCALEIVESVAKLGIEIRAGVHVGEVEQIARKVGGISVVIASRIMSAGGSSEVLVSSTVRDLVAGSRLTFDDRGTRELKGVPGEWHVYAVGRADSQTAETSIATGEARRERRASAVRRAGARPIWQRRPRLVAAGVVGLALVLATTGLLVWKPWQTPALVEVKENSIGIIDPGRNEVVGEIPVGTRPGGIAVGDGYAWVTNTADGTVSQIDLTTNRAENRIPVGRAPKGIAVAEGSVWVANSGERTVSRINAATGQVVGTAIDVGNSPTAIGAVGGLLWVANATDSTVVSIDAQSGAVGAPTGVAATPIALAVDESGLWVASEDAASISHLDPVTGITRAAPIQLAVRPSAIALDPQALWVASADGTVTRIDRAANRVTDTVDVGGNLAAIVVSGDTVWVGDQDGKVYRLNAADPDAAATDISTSSAVVSLAVVDGTIWLAAQPSAASHRGGTLHIVESPPDFWPRYGIDPLAFSDYNVSRLVADGLVGFRRVGGSAGSVLLPDLAMSLPLLTNGGRTYTFQLRPGLLYSTGVAVRASDFRRAVERSFQVDITDGLDAPEAWGNLYFPLVIGAEACTNALWTPVVSCELPSGVETDDAAGRVTFNLSEPDPDFVFKLAEPIAYPVPEGVPMSETLDGSFPGTGPYVVTATSGTEVRLARNPNFNVWDTAVRPNGFPEEIVFSVVEDGARAIAMVENGGADYTTYDGATRTPAELLERMRTQNPARWHFGPLGTHYVAMNSRIPPFDKVDARRAVNFAIDRARMAELFGGLTDAATTCQLTPPGWPGYQPYCPYTLKPDPGGLWKAPDMEEARRRLVTSGTQGAQVTVGPTFPGLANQLEYIALVLEELGYQVTLDRVIDGDHRKEAWGSGQTQITLIGWGADYLGASGFPVLLTCGGDPSGVLNYCDPEFDAAFKHAKELQTTDTAEALVEWAALDHRAVDDALLAPTYNLGRFDFVSARVGNYQFSPTDVVLFDQMWVQ